MAARCGVEEIIDTVSIGVSDGVAAAWRANDQRLLVKRNDLTILSMALFGTEVPEVRSRVPPNSRPDRNRWSELKVRLQNRPTLARIASVVFVQMKGLGWRLFSLMQKHEQVFHVLVLYGARCVGAWRIGQACQTLGT